MQARRGPLLSILLLATGAAAVLAGCAARETTRERVFVPYDTSRTWTGKTLEQVMEVFGRPSDREPDGKGGTLLTYDEIEAIGDTPQPRTRPASGDPTGVTGESTQTPGAPPRDRTVATKTNARFWIDAEGKVYHYEFSPEMYRKGIPSPPQG